MSQTYPDTRKEARNDLDSPRDRNPGNARKIEVNVNAVHLSVKIRVKRHSYISLIAKKLAARWSLHDRPSG